MNKLLIVCLVLAFGSLASAANRSIEKEVIVEAPLTEARKAWATNEGAQTFFSPRTNIDASPTASLKIQM